MTTFKLFVGTNIGLRDNNEDNFTVCPDIQKNEWIIPANQQAVIPLGPLGCLMVVADGMGGQNAGEVASALAIETVQRMFATAELPSGVSASPEQATSYLKKVIVEADRRIKHHSSTDEADHEGMGSTIVMAWLLGNIAHIAWLGDSRAYSFIPGKGISRLSKDHSYVQRLIDSGALTEEQAIDHPDSNVITRSLGDVTQKAKPDVLSHPVQAGEIIMLCSDGLCGVCTDEEIGGIIAQNLEDLTVCKEVLTEAALDAGGSDNITIALLKIVQVDNDSKLPSKIDKKPGITMNIVFLAIAVFILIALAYAAYKLFMSKPQQQHTEEIVQIETESDTITDEKTENVTNPNTDNNMRVVDDNANVKKTIPADNVNKENDNDNIDNNVEDLNESSGEGQNFIQ